jgi:hypothetical protein
VKKEPSPFDEGDAHQIYFRLYDNGWQWWLTTPAKHHEYTPIIKKIFACKDKECVKDVIE